MIHLEFRRLHYDSKDSKDFDFDSEDSGGISKIPMRFWWFWWDSEDFYGILEIPIGFLRFIRFWWDSEDSRDIDQQNWNSLFFFV